MPNSFRSRFANPTVWLVVLACYWCLLFVGTHLPANATAMLEHTNDKLLHILAFAILAILLSTTCRLIYRRLTWRSVAAIWIVVILYAALDEWTQDYVGRQASAWDWMADSLGAALGLATFYWLIARHPIERAA